MEEKIPYYMAYPLPCAMEDWRRERQDMEYLKSMYPGLVKQILPYIEEACDRLEYQCSMMYDEYPDKLQIYLMQRKILEKILKEEGMESEERLEELIAVLLGQEIYRRRSQERRTGGRRFF